MKKRASHCGLGNLAAPPVKRCAPGQVPFQRLKLMKAPCRMSVPRVTSASSVAEIMREHYRDIAQESVIAFMISSNNEVLSIIEISLGGIASSPVDPRLVFGAAVTTGAPAIILAHNHPSGNLEPSADDVNLTRQLKEGAKLLGVRFLDHVIVGHDDFYSFASAGKL